MSVTLFLFYWHAHASHRVRAVEEIDGVVLPLLLGTALAIKVDASVFYMGSPNTVLFSYVPIGFNCGSFLYCLCCYEYCFAGCRS